MSPRFLHTSSPPRVARFHGLEFNNQGEGHAELNDADDSPHGCNAEGLRLANFAPGLIGQSVSALPSASEVNPLCNLECVIDLDAQLPDRAFGFRMAEEQLNRAQNSSSPVDQDCLSSSQ